MDTAVWRVFGKSDRYYIKQYKEETNIRTTILLDASGTMVIDPQFVAANGGLSASGYDARLFPYYSRTAHHTGGTVYWEDPRMRRVSLGTERDWAAPTTAPVPGNSWNADRGIPA